MSLKVNLIKIFKDEGNPFLSFEKLTDKILALEPFQKLERLREELQKCADNIPFAVNANRVQFAKECLKIYNENEKAFDVREWLEEKGFEIIFKHSPNTYYKNINGTYSFFVAEKTLLIEFEGSKIYKGKIPTSQYFFEELLKALGISL